MNIILIWYLLLLKNISVKDKNEYPVELEKIMILFENLDKQKTLGNLSQAVFDFQAENEERELSLVLFRIKFDSKEIEAILKENQMYHNFFQFYWIFIFYLLQLMFFSNNRYHIRIMFKLF